MDAQIFRIFVFYFVCVLTANAGKKQILVFGGNFV